jgi:bacteriocin biosynthesis cyclodehydratase domain-containing protein
VRNPEPGDIELVALLAEVALTVDELESRLRPAGIRLDRNGLLDKLGSLVEANLVLVRGSSSAPPLSPDDEQRFSRQLPYLAELGDGVRLQHQLRQSAIAVIGCGGIGSWAIAALACLGVGRLVLVDDDVVELSNLNRQILYGPLDIGVPKVMAAADWMRRFDHTIDAVALARRMTSAPDITEVTAGVDAVVLAADEPPYEIGRWVNAACLESRTPFIVAGQVPPVLKIGPLYVPGEGACFACHESALRRESQAFDDYVVSRAASPPIASTLGPASCVVGGLIGLELLHLMTGQTPATQSAALLIDMRSLAIRPEAIRRDPDCPACKDLH